MMLASTRSVVRRMVMTTSSSVSVSSGATASIGCCRTLSAAQSIVGGIASNAFRCGAGAPTLTSTSTRKFASLPTDEGGDSEDEKEKEDKPTPPTTSSEEEKEEEEPDDDVTTATNTENDTADDDVDAEGVVDKNELNKNLKPSEIVEALDRHIVGQSAAKKSVAIAMRNRWRRRQLPEDLRKEVTPRNVLLVGPTGCGKTEVARRMAMINDAPFLKVEATKFTEVGYHGRDVDQIIRDLMDVAMQLAKKQHTEVFKEQAETMAEERILDILAGPSSDNAARGRESFRGMLRQGLLDDQEIEIDVPNTKQNQNEVDQSNPQIVAMSDLMQRLASGGKKQATERKKLPISEARGVILDYGTAVSNTTYGAIGVKVWIFKGEVFGNEKPEEESSTTQTTT